MYQEHLGVVGILARGNTIGPPGIHLSWQFPSSLGFPAKGFEIFRAPSSDIKWDTLRWPGTDDLRPDGTLQALLEGEGWTMALDGRAWLYPMGAYPELLAFTQPAPGGKLQIHFHASAVRVQLVLRHVSGPVTLSAYAGRRLTDRDEFDSRSEAAVTLSVTAPLITAIELPLDHLATLASVQVQWHESLCASPQWERAVAHLPLAQNSAEALARLEDGLRNRYAPSSAQARAHYAKEGQVDQLIQWLHLLQEPHSGEFANPGAAPDHLVLRWADLGDAPLQELHPQSMLLLSALDPNIARLLGLYWVDRFGSPDGPKPGRRYDYKVVGHWPGRSLCGLALALGEEEPPLPAVRLPASGEQIEGIRWQGRDPIGRVRLSWTAPLPAHPRAQVTRAVSYDLERTDETLGLAPQLLTETKPILAPSPAQASESVVHHVDPRVPIGRYDVLTSGELALLTYRYRVRGIDLFGQVGEPVQTGPVQMRDLEAPPPPIRLKARLLEPGYPWRGPLWHAVLQDEDQYRAAIEAVFGPNAGWLHDHSASPAAMDLWFEYGVSQQRQSPDAKDLQIYWRADSLTETAPLKVLSIGSSAEGTTLRISPNPQLERFAGGFLTNVNPDPAGEAALPVSERERIPIQQILNDHHLLVVPSWRPTAGRRYWLTSSPYNRACWEATGRRLRVQPPLTGRAWANSTLAATGVVSIPDAEPQGPALMLPGEGRPVPAAPLPEVTELLLDLELLEPGLLTGGTIEIDGEAAVPILYSTAGAAASYGLDAARAARLGIARSDLLQPGQTVLLKLRSAGPPDKLARAFQVELDRVAAAENLGFAGLPGVEFARRAPGGELAWWIDGGADLRQARVVSSVREAGGRSTLWIQTAGPAVEAELQGRECSYYAPYWVRLAIDVGPEPKLPLKLPIGPEQGTRSAFFAVQASDIAHLQNLDLQTRAANEGPLSAPVQVTAVRPPPALAPEAPIPCQVVFGDGALEAGYATPPDREGRATVCLKWRYDGSATAPAALRFEVARALDSTIVMAARRAWQRGDLAAAHQLQGQALTLSGPLALESNAAAGSERSLVVRLTAALPDGMDKQTLVGGRLEQQGAYARVVQARLGADRSSISLRIQVLRGTFQFGATTPATLIGVPRVGAQTLWEALKADATKLRQLAALPLNEGSPVTPVDEAFGLVTGVPLSFQEGEGLRFRDVIPGIGRNRYFYCVRAVDSAENRGPWSAVSVPWHQVDTTPPNAPEQLESIPGDRTVTLAWTPVQDAGVAHYAVYRHTDGGQATGLSSQAHALLEAADLEPPPLRVSAGTVLFPQPMPGTPAPSVIEVEPAGGPATNLYLDETRATALEAGVVQRVNPLAAEGTPVTVSLDTPSGRIVLNVRPGSDTPLRIETQAVDLHFDLDLAAVEGLFEALPAIVGTLAPELIRLPSYLDTPSVAMDLAARRITNLDGVLEDGTEVLVVVRLADDSLRVLRHAPGRLEPLRVVRGAVALHLNLTECTLASVKGAEQAPAELRGRELRLAPSRLLHDDAGQIVGISDLNPLLPAGTPVHVALGQQAASIAPVKPLAPRLSWVDRELVGGQAYRYAVRAVKQVTTGGPGAPAATIIEGPPCTPVTIVALDRRVPPAPAIAAAWHLGPDPAGLQARLTIRPEVPPAAIRVERSDEGGAWQSLGPRGSGGWQAWVENEANWVLVDADAAPDRRWRYRARARLADGRVSDWSPAFELPPAGPPSGNEP